MLVYSSLGDVRKYCHYVGCDEEVGRKASPDFSCSEVWRERHMLVEDVYASRLWLSELSQNLPASGSRTLSKADYQALPSSLPHVLITWSAPLVFLHENLLVNWPPLPILWGKAKVDR